MPQEQRQPPSECVTRQEIMEGLEQLETSSNSHQNCEALTLILLQSYIGELANSHEALLNVQDRLDQVAPVSEFVTPQDLREIRTACACLHRLRVRIEAHANETARTVAGQQLRVMDHDAGTRQGANHSQTTPSWSSPAGPGYLKCQ